MIEGVADQNRSDEADRQGRDKIVVEPEGQNDVTDAGDQIIHVAGGAKTSKNALISNDSDP